MRTYKMSEKEVKYVSIIEAIKVGRYNISEGARSVDISVRQMRRLVRQYEKSGVKGIIHKGRGKKSNYKTNHDKEERIIELYREKYFGMGPSFTAEKMLDDAVEVNRETLRLILKRNNLFAEERKRKKVRKRRMRSKQFGDMLQLDGSFEFWLHNAQERTCLLSLIDDATSMTMSLMSKEETTNSALSVLYMWITKYGIPKSVYVDLKSTYVSPKDLGRGIDIEDSDGYTHFKKACYDLGIRIIKAYSPQAKGRVERLHRTAQDRLIKELKLRQIDTIQESNEYLQRSYIDAHNKKFSIAPLSTIDGHRDIPCGWKLEHILCFNHSRILSNDGCISFENQIFQISSEGISGLYPKAKIVVKKLLDGSITLWINKIQLKFKQLSQRPKNSKIRNAKDKTQLSKVRSISATKNKNKSPWGQYNPDWLKKKSQGKHPMSCA